MSAEIIVALLALAGTIVGSGLGVLASARLTTYRICQLEKKVDKHNSVIERMYKLEKTVESFEELCDEKFKVANHRIEDLEKGGKE